MVHDDLPIKYGGYFPKLREITRGCVCIYIYIHTYTYMCKLVFLPVHISTYLRCKYIYTYTYTVCMCIYIYVCVCGHMQCKDAPFFKAWNPVSKQPLHSGNLFFWDQLKIMDQDQLQLSVCRSLPY